jgi:predicted N-acetyltransferase YhbS
MKDITIRLEKSEDYKETENLTREAFWDIYKPGCNEHLILHKIRDIQDFIKELDFVVCDNDKIVGNIIYSKANIINDKNQKFTVLCMGPFSVLPSHQKKGIGSLLLKYSIEKAKSLGYKGVIIFGNPGYYHKFGFKNAEEYGIQTSTGENFDAFMALELYENGLKGIKGKLYDNPVSSPKDEELKKFEKEFPYREKHITDTQLK